MKRMIVRYKCLMECTIERPYEGELPSPEELLPTLENPAYDDFATSPGGEVFADSISIERGEDFPDLEELKQPRPGSWLFEQLHQGEI